MKKRRTNMPLPRRSCRPAPPALEWISDTVGKTPRVTAIGSCRILIENHTGVLDFTDVFVRLSTANGPLCLRGRNLSLCEVRKNALIVRGRIRQLELPDEEDSE